MWVESGLSEEDLCSFLSWPERKETRKKK